MKRGTKARRHGGTKGRAFVAMAALAAAGGSCGPRDFENENDRLRSRVIHLEREVESLRADRDEHAARAAELARAHDAATPSEAIGSVPRVASLDIAGLSGFVAGSREGDADMVVFYVRPLDGRRRFTQAAGTLTVEAIVTPPLEGGGATEPRVYSRTLEPEELREAYREGLTGIHYTVEIPLEERAEEGSTVLMRATLADAVTGLVHRAERAKPARRTSR